MHVGVNYFTPLVRVAEWHEVAPDYVLESQVEVWDEQRVDEVNEGVTNTALRLQIHRQVKVVVLTLEVFVN